jgi:hypothetical protein
MVDIVLPADLDRFLPDEAWFRHRPRGIHGTPHTTRVLVWAAVLASRIGRPNALRRDELLWAAAVHDVGRLDDGIDRGHGRRSADWVLADLTRKRPEAATCDLKLVAELCTWHEIADDRIERLSLELLILKDADGLDRARIGDLDPDRLRFQHARRLVEAAERLERATNAYDRIGAEEVLEAAQGFPE